MLFSLYFFVVIIIGGGILTLLLLFTDSSLTDAMGLDMASASMVGKPQVEKSFWEMTLKEIGAMVLSKDFYMSHGFWYVLAGIVIIYLLIKLHRQKKKVIPYYAGPLYIEQENDSMKYVMQ